MNSFIGDSDFSLAQRNGGDVVHRPFLNAGNLDNYLIERFVQQSLEDFSTPAMGTAATADDGGNGLNGDTLYLVDESPLDPAMIVSGIAAVSRFWIPEWISFEDFGQVAMNLPDIRGLSYDPGSGAVVPTYDDNKRSIAIGLGETAVSSVVRKFTSGTFTVSYDGSTTAALAYNADASTIQAAIRALSSDLDDVIVSWFTDGSDNKNGVFSISQNASSSIAIKLDSVTFDFSGLSHAAETVDIPIKKISDTTYRYELFVFKDLYEVTTSTAHGLTTGNQVYINFDSSSFLAEVTVVDTDTFTFQSNISVAQKDALNISAAGVYYPRSKNLKARFTYQFYIPGVTAGISSAEDIPDLQLVDSDYKLFKAMVDEEDEVDIQSTRLERIYPGVYHRIVTSIKLKDIYD